MPPRSVKMKRFIFGFQRRVWWPKWTPASKSSRMLTTGIAAPFLVDGTSAGVARVEPTVKRPAPSTRPPAGTGTGTASLATNQRQKTSEVVRKRGSRLDPLAGERVREGEFGRVQELALQPRFGNAVDGIPGDREVDRGQMDADLMRAAGLEVDAEQRVMVEESFDVEVRHRLARTVGFERVPHRVVAVTADRRLDPSAARARTAADERQVRALELTLRHLLLQPLVRVVRARDDQEPRGVSVEAVDDAGAIGLLPALGAELEEAVDERARVVSGRRVDDEARRLVDDEQVRVLICDP